MVRHHWKLNSSLSKDDELRKLEIDSDFNDFKQLPHFEAFTSPAFLLSSCKNWVAFILQEFPLGMLGWNFSLPFNRGLELTAWQKGVKVY